MKIHDPDLIAHDHADLLILQDAMNGAGYDRSSQESLWVYQHAL